MGKNLNKKFEVQTKHNRIFSEEYKRQKIKEIEQKVLSIKGLCEQAKISRSSVYNWLYLYGSAEKGCKTVVQMESEQKKTQRLQERLAELERIIGQKQLQIDVLEKSMELISAELGYDVKKKYVIPRLNGFECIEKNTDIR